MEVCLRSTVSGLPGPQAVVQASKILQNSSRLLFDARLSFAEKIEKSRVQPMVSLQLVTNVLLPSLLVRTVW